MKQINLVIPTTKLNERLFAVIEAIKEKVSSSNSSFQLTLVLNPARKLEFEEIRTLERLQVDFLTASRGLGNALKESYRRNTCDTLVFVPDDLPFGFQEIDLALEFDSRKQDLLVLSKYKKSSKLTRRFVAGRIFRFMSGSLFRISVSDTQCSFIASSRAVSLFAENCREVGYLITLENIVVAQKYNLKVSQVEAKWKTGEFDRKSNLTLVDPIIMTIQLIMMRIRYWIRNFK